MLLTPRTIEQWAAGIFMDLAPRLQGFSRVFRGVDSEELRKHFLSALRPSTSRKRQGGSVGAVNAVCIPALFQKRTDSTVRPVLEPTDLNFCVVLALWSLA